MPPSIIALDGVQLASANTYALVGAAAMLAAFCRVPLTSVLLLFELTQDYTLILPTLLAVGFARWSAATAKRFAR
jgi:H+/Cl- antiporter ClcA